MFCPECGAEYREGFRECSDCRVPLVAQLGPRVESRPELELVTILESGNPARLLVAKSVLEDAGIPYLIRNERANQLFPAVGLFESAIQVTGDLEREAKELLRGIEEVDSTGSTTES